MSNEHFLQIPPFIKILRVVQLVLSVIVLGLSAANVDVVSFDAHGLAVFTSLFSILILTYYLVSVHIVPKAYNWIAVAVLEALALIFWLSTWAALAALYADLWSRSRVRNILEKRSTVTDYRSVFRAAIAFSVIQFVLFCVTAGFIGLAGWRRYSQGRRSTTSSAAAPRADFENKPEVVQTSNGAHSSV